MSAVKVLEERIRLNETHVHGLDGARSESRVDGADEARHDDEQLCEAR